MFNNSLAVSALTLTTLLMGSITQIQAASDDTVTVYSSRKEHLIQPLFEKFSEDTHTSSHCLNHLLPQLGPRVIT